MNYREMIDAMRQEWIGKTVTYRGEQHTVVDVDYNGALLIDLPARFTDTTAIGTWMVE